MIPREVLNKIRRIQIRTSHKVDDLLAGTWHSAFKGRGIEFEEVRPYQIGDDVRAIDWNVTARYNQPYVKVFEEERELTVMLLIDVSGSSEFGIQNKSKKDLALEIAAVLAFSALENTLCRMTVFPFNVIPGIVRRLTFWCLISILYPIVWRITLYSINPLTNGADPSDLPR